MEYCRTKQGANYSKCRSLSPPGACWQPPTYTNTEIEPPTQLSSLNNTHSAKSQNNPPHTASPPALINDPSEEPSASSGLNTGQLCVRPVCSGRVHAWRVVGRCCVQLGDFRTDASGRCSVFKPSFSFSCLKASCCTVAV